MLIERVLMDGFPSVSSTFGFTIFFSQFIDEREKSGKKSENGARSMSAGRLVCADERDGTFHAHTICSKP